MHGDYEMTLSYLKRYIVYGIIELVAGTFIYHIIWNVLHFKDSIQTPSDLHSILFTNSATSLAVLLAAITFLYERLDSNVFQPLELAYEESKKPVDDKTKAHALIKLGVFQNRPENLRPIVGYIMTSLLVLFVSVIISSISYFGNNDTVTWLAIVGFVAFTVNIAYVMFNILKDILTKVDHAISQINDYEQNIQTSNTPKPPTGMAYSILLFSLLGTTILIIAGILFHHFYLNITVSILH
jgi:hypothetical protein